MDKSTKGSAHYSHAKQSMTDIKEENNSDSENAKDRVVQLSHREVNECFGKGAVLIDVREPWEFKSGSLAGAINIPLSELTTKITSVLESRTTKVILVCRSGNRSSVAGSQLMDLEYRHVYSLGGGLKAVHDWDS